MAVAFDAVGTNNVASNSGTTLDISITIGASSSALGCSFDTYSGGGVTVSSVVLDPAGANQAFTKATNSTTISIGTNTEIWGLASPSVTGAKIVRITFSGTGGYCNAGVISVTGSDTTTCFSGSNSNTGTSAAPTVTVSGTAVGELTMDVVHNDSSDGTAAVSGGQTLKWGPVGTILQAAGSVLASTATNTVMPWTQANEAWAMSAASFKAAASGGALVTGWDYIQDDIYPKRALGASAAPAFVSTFRTAGIAGIAWQGPRDHAKLPPSVVFSTPPAFARPIVATPVAISGMAWDTLHETDILPKGRFLTDPVAIAYIPATVTWSFLVGDTTFLRDPPMDSPPGYGHAAFAAPVGISGMAWQTPLDWSKPQVSFTIPPAYAVTVAPVVNTNAGIPWFEPPDRDRPAFKYSIEALPALVLTPATLPVPIRGMAWFIPPGPLNKGTLGTDWPASHTLKPTVQIVTLSKRRPTLFIANVGRLMN